MTWEKKKIPIYLAVEEIDQCRDDPRKTYFGRFCRPSASGKSSSIVSQSIRFLGRFI